MDKLQVKNKNDFQVEMKNWNEIPLSLLNPTGLGDKGNRESNLLGWIVLI